MEWDSDKCMQLIELYRAKPEIWQSTHKFYSNKNRKQNAWCAIASDMGTSVDVTKSKINSLLSSFRREKAKEENSLRTAKSPEEAYRSKWFGYEAFHFLFDKNKVRQRRPKEEQSPSEKENNVTENEEQITVQCDVYGADGEEDTVSPYYQMQDSGSGLAKKRRVEMSDFDTQTDPGYDSPAIATQPVSKRDASEVYGEHIAMKLRGYNKRTQAVVQHLFSNILFNADMGHYDMPMALGGPGGGGGDGHGYGNGSNGLMNTNGHGCSCPGGNNNSGRMRTMAVWTQTQPVCSMHADCVKNEHQQHNL